MLQGCLPGLHRGKPMNGPYSKQNNIPKSHDTPKAANRKATIPESRDTPETANKNLQKKAPIRHNRSIEKHGLVFVKKEKDHKYLLSKGPVSLLEDEPEVERAENHEKEPETKLSEDADQADESSEKKERKSGEEQQASNTTTILLVTLTAFTILALLGVLYVGRKVKQASNRVFMTTNQ